MKYIHTFITIVLLNTISIGQIELLDPQTIINYEGLRQLNETFFPIDFDGDEYQDYVTINNSNIVIHRAVDSQQFEQIALTESIR